MTQILSDIGNSINKGIGSTYNFAATSKWCAKTLECAAKNPDKYSTAMVVASIVSKDLISCYYYYTQSMNNKKIPEEKRKFVASLDLMNGVLMVGGQLLAGIVFEKTLNDLLFKKLIDKKLDKDALANHAEKAIKEAEKAGHKFDVKELETELIKQFGSDSKKYKTMKSGFKLLIVLSLTTALTKRVLAPLLATPLAGWYKDNHMDKKKNKDEKSDIGTHGDVYIPWAYTNNNGDSKLNKVAVK